MCKGVKKNLHVKGWRYGATRVRLIRPDNCLRGFSLVREKQNVNFKALVNNGCYSLSRFSSVSNEERKAVHADYGALPSDHVHLRFASLSDCSMQSIITQAVTIANLSSLIIL